MKNYFGIGLLFLMSFSLALGQGPTGLYGPREDRGLVANPDLDEASGLAASRVNPGLLWTHNDSGGFPHLYALDTHGKSLGKVILVGVNNRDWEDLAVGPGPLPGRSYLYIADIGDNDGRYPVKTILRLPEPSLSRFVQGKCFLRADSIAQIRFRYPDGNHDAETLVVDPRDGAIYVITKAKPQGRLFKIPSDQAGSEPVLAQDLGPVPVRKAVSGEISPQGDEILVKNYFFVYHWTIGAGQPLADMFGQSPTMVPYLPEPQGEALCFDPEGHGFYTLSEERDGVEAHLYFYPRNVK